MADIPVSKSRGKKYLGGSTPMVPSFIVGDDPIPLNPPGSITPSGGTDPDAVHYNVSDGKNSTEQNQARVNIGSFSSQETATTSPYNDVPRLTNYLVFTPASVLGLTGLVEGFDGEIVQMVNKGTFRIEIRNNNPNSLINNRFNVFDFAIFDVGDTVFARYNSSLMKWELVRPSVFEPVNNTYRINRSIATGPVTALLPSQPTFHMRALTGFGDRYQIYCETNAGVFRAGIRNDGQIIHERSAFSFSSIRRDEKFLNTSENVVTSGSINNQAITAGIFNQRFTLATSITGHANGENGRELTINNANTISCDLVYESASSTAANRYYFATLANLTIPSRGIVTLIYNSTVSRWELKSKNF